MRSRWSVALIVSLALVVAGPAFSAAATDPIDLGSGYVLDEVGVLTPAEKSAAEDRLRAVYDETGIDLYVAIVDDFTNPSNSQQWADEVAADNGLGRTQYLLAIATDGRQYYISADTAGPLSDDRLTAIERDLRPFLSDGDYAGAIDSAAQGVAGGSGGDGSGSILTIVLAVVAALAVVAVVIVVIVRRRRKTAPASAGEGAGIPQVPTEELARQAASALIATDDAIRTSEQELGFATAQFGETATTEFAAALQSAREKLGRAFTIQQQLDDTTPDSEEQVREWNSQILQLCAEANDELDEKAAAFDELRKIEQEAPAALTRVRDARTAAAAAIDVSAGKLAALQRAYAPEALETVDDNVDQARARVAFADEQIAAAQKALDAADSGEAAVGIRAAEESVGQAVLLEQAIDTLANDLATGEQQAAALIDALEQDIRTAQTLPDPDGRIGAAIAATRTDIDTARSELAGPSRRPLQTLKILQASDQRIDEVVQSVRDAASRAQRLQQQFAAEMAQAQAQYSAAESFVTARRGAVGAEARTRLAESGAAIARALQLQLQTAAPDQALQEAQRANALAGQAIQAARADVGGFAAPGGFVSGGGGGGGSSFVGAVLGGIVGEMLTGGGGGHRGRSSSGGFSGFGGLGGRSSGGRSSFRSGSFGGGGTRGRRGGGRF